MFILKHESEQVEISIKDTGAVFPVYVGYEDTTVRAGGVNITRADNLHSLVLGDGVPHVILRGPTTNGSVRTLVSFAAHNPPEGQKSVVVGIALRGYKGGPTYDTPITLVYLDIEPSQTLTYSTAGGWLLVPANKPK